MQSGVPLICPMLNGNNIEDKHILEPSQNYFDSIKKYHLTVTAIQPP
jgi:hypothetical protein